MPTIKCVECSETAISTKTSPALCTTCTEKLQREINRIDRNDDRYTKRGKIKNRLDQIPDQAIPDHLALHIEQVADPEINQRKHCLGRLDELKTVGDKEIHNINNDYTEQNRGETILKKRYR